MANIDRVHALGADIVNMGWAAAPCDYLVGEDTRQIRGDGL